jgi:phage recombination protein Bet
MTTALSAKLPSDLVGSFSEAQVDLIKSVIAVGATDDELKLFLYTAKRTGLDPLTKQIHFVKREVNKKLPNGAWVKEGQMTVQTGIDGYRAIAERTGNLAGISDAVYDSEDGEYPKKATVTVYKMLSSGQRVEYTSSARWSEYAQTYTRNGETVVGPMWKKMPYLMLAKCAEALALRKAFPNDLSGLYTTEEMQQADNNVVAQKARQDVPTVQVLDETPPVAESRVEAQEESNIIDVSDESPQVALPEVKATIEMRPIKSGTGGDEVCGVCEGTATAAEAKYSRFVYNKVACRKCQPSLRK